MAKARQIQKQFKAVRNIRTITKTMEMIAVSRFKKAHDKHVAFVPVQKGLAGLVAELALSQEKLQHPLLEARSGPAALLVVTSFRGLCGGYNNRVMDVAGAALADLGRRQPAQMTIIGKKGISQLRFRRFPKPQQVLPSLEDNLLYEQARELADAFMAQFTAGKIGSLHVASMRMVSAGQQRAQATALLPLELPAPQPGQKPSDLEFMPSQQAVLDQALPMIVRLRLYGLLLEAAVSEQLARMSAMRSATTNADDMSRALTIRINRARQGQITTELSEIMGGSEAMK